MVCPSLCGKREPAGILIALGARRPGMECCSKRVPLGYELVVTGVKPLAHVTGARCGAANGAGEHSLLEDLGLSREWGELVEVLGSQPPAGGWESGGGRGFCGQSLLPFLND